MSVCACGRAGVCLCGARDFLRACVRACVRGYVHTHEYVDVSI